MKKLFLNFILSLVAVNAVAQNTCPKTTNVKADEIIFFYKKINKNEVLYIPFARLKNNELKGANNIMLPETTTIYFLKNDKPIELKFKNELERNDENICRSTAYATLNEGNKNEFEIFANKPLAKDFNFALSKEELEQFSAQIQTPCSKAKPNYNEDGIMTCDASQLIATSHFADKKQFWYSKQFRYALGFGVDNLENGKFNEVVGDCSHCAD